MNIENILTTTSDQPYTSKDMLCKHVTAVWLGKDPNNEQENSIISGIKEQVKEMKVFDYIDVCIDYILSLEDETVLIIVSDIFSGTIIPLIYEIPSIAAIYLYCEICLVYENMNDENHNKVAGICSTEGQLITAINGCTIDNNTHNEQEKSIITRIKEQVKEMEVFDDADMCIDYISSLEDETVLIIVSDIFSGTIIPLIYEIPSIATIYLYCETCVTYNSINDRSYNKVAGIFNTQDQLSLAVRHYTNDNELCDPTSYTILRMNSQYAGAKSLINNRNMIKYCIAKLKSEANFSLITSASSAEILFSLLEVKECVSLHTYIYGPSTDISSRSNWMKTFANNIRGLYCNTDDLSQQLANDAIKFYIEVANLAVTLREELHTLAAVCYKKSIDLLEIHSHDKVLQSTIYDKLMVSVVLETVILY
ncbi:hypothetical protein I4U23_005329 [Adineta vaga]|nr:hypothetical protein I4U23_005329 [Adineta vaga]